MDNTKSIFFSFRLYTFSYNYHTYTHFSVCTFSSPLRGERFCNVINISISLFEFPPYVKYSIAPFVLGETNLNNLQPEFNIYNGSCTDFYHHPHCFEQIDIDSPGYYAISIGPTMCSICNPHSTNSCCPVSFGFNITYGLWPADNY